MNPVVIDGLQIHFPYVPYDCQQSFMRKVINSLNQGSNAALESPTGTGKTLSLLCASLAWLLNEKQRLKPNVAPNFIDPAAKPSKGGDDNSNANLYPRIYYASRTHSQLQQVVRELNKSQYKSLIKVATIAGREQLCIHDKVMKESKAELKAHMCRTMVRKRTCHYYSNLDKEGSAVEELYKMEAKGNVMDIEDLITTAKKLRHCPFYRSRQMDNGADLVLLPYNYILDPKTRAAYEIKLRGNILIFDEAHNLESIAEESISIDFSTKMLALSVQECKRAIELILDEEEEMRSRMDNSDVSFASLMNLKGKKKQKQEEILVKRENVAFILNALLSFEEHLSKVDFMTEGVSVAKLSGRILPGNFLVSLLEKAGFNRANQKEICKVIDQIGVFFTNSEKNSQLFEEKGANLSEFSNLLSKVFVDTFEGLVLPTNNEKQQCVNERDLNNDVSRFYQLYVEATKEDEGSERIKFHYWCFSAGVAMRFLQSRGVRSIILASGTLSPMASFISTMTIPFANTLENGHAARGNQFLVGSLLSGNGGTEISGTYGKRNSNYYKTAIGEILLDAAKTTPQGVLAFFPSYAQLTMFVDHCKTTKVDNQVVTIWSQLEKYKRVFIEPKSKAEVNVIFREFDSVIREHGGNMDPRKGLTGALLLSVCRGKISEGVDFSDSHCRAVVVVGIPFPPLFDPRIVLKKNFLCDLHRKDSLAIHQDEWYEMEGYRAVNQAIGRVIRHKDDFGVVILADSRFASTRSRKLFPSWIRSAVEVFDSPKSLFAEVERFFVERGVLVERAHAKALQQYNQSLSSTDLQRKRKSVEGILENSQKALDDIVNLYGDALRSSQGQLQKRAKPVEQDATTSNVSNVDLEKLIHTLKSYPDSEKVFPTRLQLDDSAGEQAEEAVMKSSLSSTDRSTISSNSLLTAPKKMIKLKPNKKIGIDAEVSREKIDNTKSGANEALFQEESKDVAVAKLFGPKRVSGLSTNCDNALERENTKRGIDCLVTSVPSDAKRPSTSGTSTVPIAPCGVSAGQSVFKTGKYAVGMYKDPPNLDIKEYMVLMEHLDKEKKYRLWKAQRDYTEKQNFDALIETLKSVALPDTPLLLTGLTHTSSSTMVASMDFCGPTISKSTKNCAHN